MFDDRSFNVCSPWLHNLYKYSINCNNIIKYIHYYYQQKRSLIACYQDNTICCTLLFNNNDQQEATTTSNKIHKTKSLPK